MTGVTCAYKQVLLLVGGVQIGKRENDSKEGTGAPKLIREGYSSCDKTAVWTQQEEYRFREMGFCVFLLPMKTQSVRLSFSP